MEDLKPCFVVLNRKFPCSRSAFQKVHNQAMSDRSSLSSDSECTDENVEIRKKRKSMHNASNSEENKKESSTPKKKHLSCSKCEDTFNTHESFLSHHRQKHLWSSPFKCVLCKENFKFRTSYVAHMKQNHPEKKLYPCPYSDCERSFEKKKELKDHQKSHYKYVCRFCKARYVRQSDMRYHVAAHHD